MNFPQYLISQGFKPYRKVYSKQKKWEYIPCEYDGQYSTMISGGLDFRFLKDDIEIIFGLNERNCPPVIVYPRPSQDYTDRDMEKLLNAKGNEETLKILLNVR